MAGEISRGEAEQRSESGSGSGSGGGKRDSPDAHRAKRDSDASSGSEGSQQRQTQAQQGQTQGQAGKNPVQQQPADDGIEKEVDKSQAKRHVEASPQGRYLRFEDKLGTGQYKVVYRSYDTSMGIEVAWNTVNIKNLPKEEKKRIMNEVRLLQNLEHKNLVQFHGSWVNREREEVIFVTEIMQSGSLME